MPRKQVTAGKAPASKSKKMVTAKNRAHGKVKPSTRAMKKGNVPGVPTPAGRVVFSTKSTPSYAARHSGQGIKKVADVKRVADRKVAMSKLKSSPVVKKLQALSPKKPTRKKPPKQGATRRTPYTYIPSKKAP
jgi:hypothetical protein